jgi:hypothetical protein
MEQHTTSNDRTKLTKNELGRIRNEVSVAYSKVPSQQDRLKLKRIKSQAEFLVRGALSCIFDGYCCCAVDIFFLQDCGMQCYVDHTLSATRCLFLLLFPCKQARLGRTKG